MLLSPCVLSEGKADTARAEVEIQTGTALAKQGLIVASTGSEVPTQTGPCP